MADQWYYMRGQERVGPLTDEQIQELYQRGEITDASYVWAAGMPDWAPAGQVRDRFAGAVGGLSGNMMHDLGLDEPVVRPYTYTPGGGGGGGGYGDYAGFWLRFVASMIDGVIFGCVLGGGVMFVLGMMMMNMSEEQAFVFNMLGNFVFSFVSFAIYAAFEASSWQGTPGKKLLRIRVTDLDGGQLSFARAFGRNCGKIVSQLILMIGFIMAGFTERKQALHDMMAGCLVVRD
jgi:uncharacterized RDD family membrane protein YckC